jgi:hypothetical protein
LTTPAICPDAASTNRFGPPSSCVPRQVDVHPVHLLARQSLARAGVSVLLAAVDFHVTQTVNGEKGIHGMLKKGLLF